MASLKKEKPRINILSIGSQMYGGIVNAQFISFMEQKAYLIATQNRCIEPRKSERISMIELFDFVAGSDTGAIIGSTLVIKNDDPATMDVQKNKYFADTTVNWYLENSDLYHDNEMPVPMQVFLVLALTCLASFGMYKLVRKIYVREQYEDRVVKLLNWVSDYQRHFFISKDSPNYKEKEDQLVKELQEVITDMKYLDDNDKKMINDLTDNTQAGIGDQEESDAEFEQLEKYRDLTLFE